MDSATRELRIPALSAQGLRSLIVILGVLALPLVQAATPQDDAQVLGLKLDLGLALGPEDCEDDYAELVNPGSVSGSSNAHGSTVRSDAMLAKLSSGFESAAPVAALPTRTVSAPAPMAEAVPQHAAATPAAPAAQAAASMPAAPITSSAPAEAWEIAPADKTLNTALARWAATAGWQLLWELPIDYSVDARTTIRGSFEQAVTMVAKSMESAEIPMKAIFYEGNRVLRIVARGAE
ncbi:MAG TPA: toxin co-regulated pilus biosynthesis Q family protein [Noviherbaspirillum sp.]